jgi:hypothetical protein
MASIDIAPVVAALKAKIESVADIGLVWPHDIFDSKDLRPMLVSSIDNTDTMRAWWITGPSLRARTVVARPGGAIDRTWSYTIYGIEGLRNGGASIETLRANGLAICDAIDADPGLAGSVHRSEPCNWRIAPENRAAWAGIGASFMAIEKTVVTLSSP